ncbi:hypothetical protein PanWU01x14_106170, partial [Parasponia andersonii]
MCSWLSFLRVSFSEVVRPFVRGERDRETPTISLALNDFPQMAPNCWSDSYLLST